jgi:DNA-binding transcriptional ArsR family regulator
MARGRILRDKEDDLLKDLKESTLSYKKLGKQYGVSGQAIHAFYKRHRIKRPKRRKGHKILECRLCQKLIQINKKPHSEFISIQTIVKQTGEPVTKYSHHLRILRDKGLVDEKFGRLRSKRAEKAYQIYFTERLPICRIGWKVGIKNFYSLIRKHRELGWNVPASLYVYGVRKRSRIQSEIQRKKQR